MSAYREPGDVRIPVSRALIEQTLVVLGNVSSYPAGRWGEMYDIRNRLSAVLAPSRVDVGLAELRSADATERKVPWLGDDWSMPNG